MSILKSLFTVVVLAAIVYGIYTFFVMPLLVAKAEVLHMIDPDSYIVMQDNKIMEVQLIGIDAPESANNTKQCYHKIAKQTASTKFFGKNREVTMEADNEIGDKDIHGRFLRYMKLSDGTLLNEELIKDGLAREYHSSNSGYRLEEQFNTAENDAKDNNIGIWKACEGKMW